MLPEDLYELELLIIERVLGTWTQDVEAFKAAVLVLVAGVDGVDKSIVIDEILALLLKLKVPEGMVEEAELGILDAHAYGVELATKDSKSVVIPDIPVSKNSQSAVRNLSQDAEDAIEQVRKNLSEPLTSGGLEGVITAVAPVIQNPAKARGSVAWSVNNASNSAVSKIAVKTGQVLTIIPERDACVVCQRYAGMQSTGAGFPTGLTFGRKPIVKPGATFPHPPLHINCRCEVRIGISKEYADALKREAVRSILRGTKLPSESERVRIEAARELLEDDPEAPQTVKKAAERRIKAYDAEQALKAERKKAREQKRPKDVKTLTPLTNADKIRNAEIMYGTNSKQHKEAIRRFGKK